MKRMMLLLLALMLAAPALAGAEVYFIDDESGLPADWAERDTLRMTVLDTNQSDAIILQCGGEAMLVDGGDKVYYSRLFSMLDSYGITSLKYLFSTHCHYDHSGGLTVLMNSERYSPAVLLSPNPKTYSDEEGHHKKMVTSARLHNVPYQQISDGDVFTLGSATITVIRCDEPWGQNNRSAVCRVEFNGGKILLLADVQLRVLEHWMATRDPAEFDCDVMKANHHGIDSVPEAFLEAASPSIIVCTTLLRNRHAPTLEQLGALYTGEGTVYIETDGADWYVWQDPNWVD